MGIDMIEQLNNSSVQNKTENTKVHIVVDWMNNHIKKHAGMVRMSSGEIVAYAAHRGLEITALCTYRWVPKTGQPPMEMDTCVACVRTANDISAMEG